MGDVPGGGGEVGGEEDVELFGRVRQVPRGEVEADIMLWIAIGYVGKYRII